MISQITTNYGLDLYGKPQLAELLRALGEVEIPWIRVHYAYPTGLTAEVLSAYREVANVLPYLDLPLQHSHPEVLRAMNRPWQADVTGGVLRAHPRAAAGGRAAHHLHRGLSGRNRGALPAPAGFRGRTAIRPCGRVHLPPEEAPRLPACPIRYRPRWPPRKDRLMALQQPIAAARNASWVGRIVDVLIEQEHPGSGEMLGRCARFAPDVDGEVRVLPGEEACVRHPAPSWPFASPAPTPMT